MVCPRCGSLTPEGGRCARCGNPLEQTTVATGVLPIDTTGLPIGATFEPGTTAAPHAVGSHTEAGATRAIDPSAAATGITPPEAAIGPLTIGHAFGPRYHVIRVLGAGGMGAVYQAWDSELNVAVALKVIRGDKRKISADDEKRFKNELLMARQVTHKHVLRIHDLGTIDGIKYITMPYVQGDDLASVLRRSGKMPIGTALRYARQIASGLEAAHEAGVVHRDLKPANVMIGVDDNAQIMDFGISASTDQTAGGGVVGTLEYMAPEQAMGSDVDARADIYAFGLILYEMLTGPRRSHVSTAHERVEAMKQRITKGVPPIKSIDDSIPGTVADVVTRCLQHQPESRYQTTTELVADLDRIDEHGHLIPEPRRLTPRLVAATAALVLLLLGGTYFVTRRAVLPVAQHEPVSVLIADFQNATNDQTFDRSLEPMMKLALEGAGFISAYDRSGITRSLGVRPPDKLDEQAAQQIAVKQGVGVVVSGSIDRQGNRYAVSMKATQAVTGNVLADVRDRASSKDQVLAVATRLASSIRDALGDDTPESDRRFGMETLSATSMDVVREYAAAALAMSNGRFEEARGHFSTAAQRDPNFGLAYAGLAISSRNIDKQQDAEKYIKEAVRHLDGMTERERYRTRGLFYMITGDHQQCAKEFDDLIARYSGDASARNNLALCLTGLRQVSRAVEEMQQVVKILPKRALYRSNLAQYADYAGDFQTAEREVAAMEQPGLFGLLALVFSQLGQGRLADAAGTFAAMGKTGALGTSYAASGLGDIAVYEGRYADAGRIYTQGAAADLAAQDPDRAANKFAALAHVQLLRQQKAAAVAAADKALANSKAVKIRFLAAQVFVEANATAKAQALASSLETELQAEPQAYAKIIDGEIALRSGTPREAVKLLTDANGMLDTWIGHFDLGRAFLAAGAFTQADSEFDRCFKRRGEALALFLDEEPTYGYFPPVYYYQGRVREGLNAGGFADSYRAYLDIRGRSNEDPLLSEVRRRVGH